ncbi:MAG: PQQ-binding-like beta-propeller repeat protein [Planctomycetota bacterium]|nr:PQQ-binding-like beta-propeller repeat protein [Planctomycetota bacterium]MDA1248028.1 PQQ-binding-like beta-propeller repeat protein [Planctomycetota bacterium]
MKTRLHFLKFAAVLATLGSLASAEDWPAWQHDSRRSGFSGETIDATDLGIEWTWQSGFLPEPAWHGPAKWDAYAKIRNLPSMRSYDLVFQPVVAGGRVFFGSTSDDTLYSIDAKTGEVVWEFTTDGPIRIAPTIAHEKVYFGSDDGFVYCLTEDTGKLIWKFRPTSVPSPPTGGEGGRRPDEGGKETPEKKNDSPTTAQVPLTRPAGTLSPKGGRGDGATQTEKKFLNNGRFIPVAPCRTGVLIDGETAWFGYGLLPWNPSFLCAVDVNTGRPEGAGRFVKKLSGKTLEGAPALSSKLVLFPQGRVAPQVFSRVDGKDLGQLKKSGGGSLVVVSLDKKIFHGPGTDSRKGGIAASDPEKLEMVAGYGRGNALVVNERHSFMLNGDDLVATDLATQKTVFNVPSRGQLALIGAGQTLFVGGEDLVEAFSIKDGKKLWSHAVNGKAYGLAASDGRLFVSTDTGQVYSFRAGAGSGKPSDPSIVENETGSDGAAAQTAAAVDDEHLIGRWVFQPSKVEGKTLRNLAGGRPGQLAVAKQFEQVGSRQALVFDGSQQSVLISPSHRQAKVPRKTMSASAWVRVDEPQTWGGLIGAVQDNGDFERGWILGFRDSKFSFALAGAEGNGRLTYLTAKDDFQLRHWHHVAATYDGTTMSLFVDGKLSAASTAQKGDIHYPPSAFYEIGAYHDNDENHRLTGALHEVRVYDDVLTAEEIAAQHRELADDFPKPRETHQLALGPWLEFTKPGEAIVRWRTLENSPTVLELTRSGHTLDTEKLFALPEQVNQPDNPISDGPTDRIQISESPLRTEHFVLLTGLKRNRIYHYTIQARRHDQLLETAAFECDTFFNYCPTQFKKQTTFLVSGVVRGPESLFAADQIRKHSGVDRGICLVSGLVNGDLAAAIARSTRLRVICVDTDAARVEAVRKTLKRSIDGVNLYGGRVTAHVVNDLNDLPFVGHFASLVVSERMLWKQFDVSSRKEILRVLRPDGGMAVLGSNIWHGKDREDFTSKLLGWGLVSKAGVMTDDEFGVWMTVTRGPLEETGEWSHLYGNPDNSAFAGETLAGAKTASDFAVQWIGRPGPRYQSDRSGRKPSPLATGGRLFLQGLDRIVAVDSYNGSVLWSLEIPGFRRFNVPRDSSNWCADRDFVYAVVRDRVWQIDARNGQVKQFLETEQIDGREWKADWSFVAREGNRLIGTSVKADSAWTDYSGKEGWYDARSGPEAAQICSDRVFAKSIDDGSTLWSKQAEGVVLNSTITISDGKVFFVECRHPDVVKSDERRIVRAELWQQQFLVAMDTSTGSKLWEKSIDTEDGIAAFYLAHSKGRLIAVSSNDKNYNVYSFSGDGGEQQWKQTFGWIEGKGDHGKAMSRPAIVGDRLFVRPRVLSLSDGKLLEQTMPGGGCGTYACSTNALFFRSGEVTVWDNESGRTTKWDRLRPDCWLSTIPAGGMLLSPEGGGGCSCGNWLETSIGFMPVARRR